MQWRSFAFVAVVCWVLWPSVGMAQANPVDTRERFQLFAQCEPMDLFVWDLDTDAVALGITRDSVQTAVESRLRSARLYSAESFQLLGIEVNVIGGAFSILLQFYKLVSDQLSGDAALAATWQTGSFGTHGGDAGYIRSSVAEHMDEFLVEYLRVNEAACD